MVGQLAGFAVDDLRFEPDGAALFGQLFPQEAGEMPNQGPRELLADTDFNAAIGGIDPEHRAGSPKGGVFLMFK